MQAKIMIYKQLCKRFTEDDDFVIHFLCLMHFRYTQNFRVDYFL